jgi:dynein light chain roadblock-type
MAAVNEAEETFKKLNSYPGVKGIIVMNNDGIAIRTNMDEAATRHYISLIHGFIINTQTAIKGRY